MKRTNKKPTLIYGKHVIYEALLKRPETIERLIIGNCSEKADFIELAKLKNIPVQEFNKKTLPKDILEMAHQHVLAHIHTDRLVQDYKTFIEKQTISNDTAFLLVQKLHDTHNLGSLIRSAAAFGISGVLIPKDNQAPLSAGTLKASVGAIFEVPLVQIGNISNTLKDLKDRGFWTYDMVQDGKNPLNKEIFDTPAVFVVGNEHTGVQKNIQSICDIHLQIGMNPKCESLNAAISGAIAMQTWSTQHPNSLK